MSIKIFNYRRETDGPWAGWLHRELESVFGRNGVFIDIDGLIPGSDFVEELSRRVAECDVFLGVIGRNWIDVKDSDGTRRLDNPGDWVRVEIEAALNQKKLVIPVLVDGAQMPNSVKMPASLAPFSRRHALRLSRDRFIADVRGLIQIIRQSREEAARKAEEERQQQETARKAEEERQQQETARKAEEERQQQETARKAEEAPMSYEENTALELGVVHYQHTNLEGVETSSSPRRSSFPVLVLGIIILSAAIWGLQIAANPGQWAGSGLMSPKPDQSGGGGPMTPTRDQSGGGGPMTPTQDQPAGHGPIDGLSSNHLTESCQTAFDSFKLIMDKLIVARNDRTNKAIEAIEFDVDLRKAAADAKRNGVKFKEKRVNIDDGKTLSGALRDSIAIATDYAARLEKLRLQLLDNKCNNLSEVSKITDLQKEDADKNKEMLLDAIEKILQRVPDRQEYNSIRNYYKAFRESL